MAVKYKKLTFNNKVIAFLCKYFHPKTFCQVSANIFLCLCNIALFLFLK